jgi:hypothetical protein
MKIIHQEGYTEDELIAHILPILANCLTALKVVVGITVQRGDVLSKKAKV